MSTALCNFCKAIIFLKNIHQHTHEEAVRKSIEDIQQHGEKKIAKR
jgi:hypothetical protein